MHEWTWQGCSRTRNSASSEESWLEFLRAQVFPLGSGYQSLGSSVEVIPYSFFCQICLMCGLFLWGPLPYPPLQVAYMMLYLLINLLSISRQLTLERLVPAIFPLSSFPIFCISQPMPAFPRNTCFFWMFINDSRGNN